MDNFGFLKVAAAIPEVRVADCDRNAARIVALAERLSAQASDRRVPELGETGHMRRSPLSLKLLDAADEVTLA